MGAKIGLPKLLEQLGSPRVTNVDPLPDKVARDLYSKRDDDVEVTRAFMAAQLYTLDKVALTHKRGAVCPERRRDIARKIIQGLAIAGL